MIAWWSAALPGFGHIALSKIVNGILLIIWEFYTNISSHLNEAIIYTLTGQFELAQHVLNLRVFLLYIPVYVFIIMDTRRCAKEINQLTILSVRSGAHIAPPIKFSAPEFNYLANRNPYRAALWSVLCPGLGHFYLNRLLMGFLGLAIFIITVYFSKVLLSIPLFVGGNFTAATQIINKEWFLFFPSIYGFFTYDSYMNALEYTKIFQDEQAFYLWQKLGFTKDNFETLWGKI
jgi:TM2 domain-containing membrane protein YozV